MLCVSPVSDRFIAPDLLIGPIDRQGFRALALLAAVILCALSIYGSAWVVSRPPASSWLRILAGTVSLVTTAGLLLIAYPLLIFGALCFSTQYRTIGSVDGHEVIAETGIGLGQFPIAVGIRDGWTVDFSRCTGNTYTMWAPTLDELDFHITNSANIVTVTYRPGPTNGDTEGVLELVKPDSS